MIGFDLDGTLLDTPAGTNYDDYLECSRVQPFPEAYAKARRIAESSPVCVITGRGIATRKITQNQVNWLFQRHVPLVMQQRFAGWDVLREFKAAKLVEMECTLYVGGMGLDRDAARPAQVPFLDAKTWREAPGNGLEAIQ